MLRPEVVKQLSCPAVGMATSWTIHRKSVPCDSLEGVRDGFKRKHWPFAKGKIGKSNAKSTSLREQANEAYKKAHNDPDVALELYNQSICMAMEDSEELGMSYANRSAVYFNKQMYRECLQNIALAKRHNYPERMMKKLLDREERCMNMLANSVNPSLNDDDESKHCLMKSCLGITDDTRGIRTSRDLPVGEKVVLEKPFLLVLEPEVAYQRCDYCGACNKLNLRPCKDCTSVMFCNEDCQEQALQRYHQFECEIVDDLHHLFRGPQTMRPSYHLTLRLFWLGVLLYLEDPENFPYRCQSPEVLAKYRDPFVLEPSDYLLHLLMQGSETLASTLKAIPQAVQFTDKCIAQYICVLMYVIAVEENTSLAHRLEGKEATETLRNLLFVLVQQTAWLGEQRLSNMTCFYPFSRLIRHSCAPNAEQFLHEHQSIIVLKRPVSKGQEITIAHDVKLTTDRMIKKDRQEMCSKEYRIAKCKCEGCEADYPRLEQIESDEQLATELQTIRQETDETRKRNDLTTFLQRYDTLYPKRELAEAWEMYREFVMRDFLNIRMPTMLLQ